MYGYKVYINMILYYIGVRHILPSGIINNKPIKECGEQMVKYQGFLVRKKIADMLVTAQSCLPNGYNLKILCGHRSMSEQLEKWNNGIKKLKTKHPHWTQKQLENENRKLHADPRCGFGPHQTGGAVDITLTHKGDPIDMGGGYSTPGISKTKSAHLTPQQKRNRKILINVMEKAGFQNYPNEWWHWSFGDRAYAVYKHKPFAIYGQI